MLPAKESLSKLHRIGACATRRSGVRCPRHCAGGWAWPKRRNLPVRPRAGGACRFVAGRLKIPPRKAAVRRAGAVRVPAAGPAPGAEPPGAGAAERPEPPAGNARSGAARALGHGCPACCWRKRPPCRWRRGNAWRPCWRRWDARAGAGRHPCLLPCAESVPHGSPIAGLEAWRGLPQWEDEAPVGAPGSQPVTPDEAKARLMRLVGTSPRPSRKPMPRRPVTPSDRARIPARRASPWWKRAPAPARPWAIWHRPACGRRRTGRGFGSRPTHTRNLQRQIVQEIAHLYPDPVERAEKAVVRKGRENYFCLLQFRGCGEADRSDSVRKRAAMQAYRGAGTDRALDRQRHRRRQFRAPVFPPSWRHHCRHSAKSLTGAASASMPPARITASVSSNAPSAAPAMPPS